MRRTFCLALVAIGCGDNGSAVIDAAADAFEKLDAGIDAPPAPITITLSGNVEQQTLQGRVPEVGALVAAFSNADETTPLASAISDNLGNFTMDVPTGGLAVSGFLKATKTNIKDSYLYPAGFIADDLAMIPILMVSAANYDALSTLAQGNQINTNGLIALQVIDAAPPAGMPVENATVSSVPAASVYRYNSPQGLPSSQATDTHTDGVAYMFNVPPNVPVDVSAAKVGSTFQTHGMKAWPDALTTTFIQPP